MCSFFNRFSAYRTVLDGRFVFSISDFWVSCPSVSSTRYTNLADGGRCLRLSCLFNPVCTTKTILHSRITRFYWTSQLLIFSLSSGKKLFVEPGSGSFNSRRTHRRPWLLPYLRDKRNYFRCLSMRHRLKPVGSPRQESDGQGRK
jgi:hypothetical protein